MCRLRPVWQRWLVVDVSNGRAHVCLTYAAAVALATMINRPLDPRTLPDGMVVLRANPDGSIVPVPEARRDR